MVKKSQSPLFAPTFLLHGLTHNRLLFTKNTEYESEIETIT